MPIYEYVCQQCGENVEKLQKLSDAPLSDCPACGESALKRKMSAAGFRLSGGGWYETDFKSDGRRNLTSGGDDSGQGKSNAKTGASNESGASATGQSSVKETKAAKTGSGTGNSGD
ncbi:FmdB family zinc ribbon protein [Salinisphaera sp. Q1T1-3]|uniref:FmdB family zinc ribbon protein n=1 Tax=Salinisphaera sp. Q1T1-3 TaxID=2321229 RepID=UPI000E76C97D|nr:zinc ribbon domain-containing protein [Salinisphaera sp. Q1T1-3]RJS94742.1 zinc ribbon domain-containing protein [Salinisphaera sp. Q1T1-3]